MSVHTGQCLCGAVRYQVSGPLRGVIACHCSQCRRTSGHHVAATEVASSDLAFAAEASLSWYRSSDTAERGFCSVCGGNLFWRLIDGDTTSIMAGTLDTPTGLAIIQHIFVADKSDYYVLDEDIEQRPGW